MNELKGRVLQSDGSVINSQPTLKELLYTDRDLSGCFIDDAAEAERFNIANKLCDTTLAGPVYTEALPYAGIKWREHWFTPEPYLSMDILDWCLDNFGLAHHKDTWFYNTATNTFYFAKEEDAALFIVRWS